MWELDYKESWAPKNWCFWTMVLESPLNSKEIQPVHPKGNQFWIFIGRTDADAETPILWPPDAKNQLIGKEPECWERLRAGEGHDRGWDGWMASLTQWTWVRASSRSWWWTGKPGVLQSMDRKESDMIEWLNWSWPHWLAQGIAPAPSQANQNLFLPEPSQSYIHSWISQSGEPAEFPFGLR